MDEICGVLIVRRVMTSTVALIDTLEEKQLVNRRRLPSNRRAYLLKVTAAGRACCHFVNYGRQVFTSAESAFGMPRVGTPTNSGPLRSMDHVARHGERRQCSTRQ